MNTLLSQKNDKSSFKEEGLESSHRLFLQRTQMQGRREYLGSSGCCDPEDEALQFSVCRTQTAGTLPSAKTAVTAPRATKVPVTALGQGLPQGRAGFCSSLHRPVR